MDMDLFGDLPPLTQVPKPDAEGLGSLISIYFTSMFNFFNSFSQGIAISGW